MLGVVDGCQIPIRSPLLPHNQAAFVNRKGVHAINCHFVCDANLRIFDMSAKWSGSTHDAFMLRQSFCWERKQDFADGYILGYSAYPLLDWLLTPIVRPSTDAENQYNAAHRKARCIIERCNGVLKSRFRCLTKELNVSPINNSNIIMACVCLHNFARINNLADTVTLEYKDCVEEELNLVSDEPSVNTGIDARRKLVDTVFSVSLL